jgi:hypothetical protein
VAQDDTPRPEPTAISAHFTTIDANPTTIQFDVTRAQESVRHLLAWSLIVIFGMTIVLTFITIWIDKAIWTTARDLFTIAISTESALLGSAIGFYFGTKK